MKKLVLVIAVVALLVPTASTVAMQQARESVAQNAKMLSEWTGSLVHQVGRAIGRQRFDQIPTIIKKHKKRAAGIADTVAVLAILRTILRFFPRKKQQEVVIEMVGFEGSPVGTTSERSQSERLRAAAVGVEGEGGIEDVVIDEG